MTDLIGDETEGIFGDDRDDGSVEYPWYNGEKILPGEVVGKNKDPRESGNELSRKS